MLHNLRHRPLPRKPHPKSTRPGKRKCVTLIAAFRCDGGVVICADTMLATLRHGAIPYIPFKTNSVAQSGYEPKSQLWTRMYHFYMMNRPQFLEHYHKRSNVETTFHMIKSKFGQRLRSKSLTAQINEALCKVLCHNLCVVIQSVHELGIETNFEAALLQ